jgi:hypothetical protein
MKGILLVHMGIEGTPLGFILGVIILVCLISNFKK